MDKAATESCSQARDKTGTWQDFPAFTGIYPRNCNKLYRKPTPPNQVRQHTPKEQANRLATRPIFTVDTGAAAGCRYSGVWGLSVRCLVEEGRVASNSPSEEISSRKTYKP